MANEVMIKYQSRDGQEIQLSTADIKKYLVSGKSEFVTDQELMYFMQVCKSRMLNPFIRDCYLVKYSESTPAAIITSVDFYKKRARAQKDCRGWKAGVICKSKKDGTLRYSDGLILDDEELVGGWFKAKPAGWDDEFVLEVNLNSYLKRTFKGEITQFWSKDNQPSQIRKVALSQGLRELWTDEFQGLYTEGEVQEGSQQQTIDVTHEVITDDAPKSGVLRLKDTLKQKVEQGQQSLITEVLQPEGEQEQPVKEVEKQSPEYLEYLEQTISFIKQANSEGDFRTIKRDIAAIEKNKKLNDKDLGDVKTLFNELYAAFNKKKASTE